MRMIQVKIKFILISRYVLIKVQINRGYAGWDFQWEKTRLHRERKKLIFWIEWGEWKSDRLEFPIAKNSCEDFFRGKISRLIRQRKKERGREWKRKREKTWETREEAISLEGNYVSKNKHTSLMTILWYFRQGNHQINHRNKNVIPSSFFLSFFSRSFFLSLFSTYDDHPDTKKRFALAGEILSNDYQLMNYITKLFVFQEWNFPPPQDIVIKKEWKPHPLQKLGFQKKSQININYKYSYHP